MKKIATKKLSHVVIVAGMACLLSLFSAVPVTAETAEAAKAAKAEKTEQDELLNSWLDIRVYSLEKPAKIFGISTIKRLADKYFPIGTSDVGPYIISEENEALLIVAEPEGIKVMDFLMTRLDAACDAFWAKRMMQEDAAQGKR